MRTRLLLVYWAWLKNRDLAVTSGGQPKRICWKFRQEYPATASEAFQMSGEESFIPVDREKQDGGSLRFINLFPLPGYRRR